MESNFPEWFKKGESEVKTFNQIDFEVDIFWNRLIGQVAQGTGYNVSDLVKMNVREFFITVKNLEDAK